MHRVLLSLVALSLVAGCGGDGPPPPPPTPGPETAPGPPPLPRYPVPEAHARRKPLHGQVVQVEGMVTVVDTTCTERACPPDDSCCNKCFSTLMLTAGGDPMGDGVFLADRMCRGDECDITASCPYPLGTVQLAEGIWMYDPQQDRGALYTRYLTMDAPAQRITVRGETMVRTPCQAQVLVASVGYQRQGGTPVVAVNLMVLGPRGRQVANLREGDTVTYADGILDVTLHGAQGPGAAALEITCLNNGTGGP